MHVVVISKWQVNDKSKPSKAQLSPKSNKKVKDMVLRYVLMNIKTSSKEYGKAVNVYNILFI